jgi:predicted signal transduction protein with EAL and GGDEF domain
MPHSLKRSFRGIEGQPPSRRARNQKGAVQNKRDAEDADGEHMDARAQARRVLELELRAALSCGEFEVYYQPIRDIGAHKFVAFEALVRWNHPSRHNSAERFYTAV